MVVDKSALERENEDLRRLLNTLKDSNEQELVSRDQIIEKLSHMIQELNDAA